MGQSQKDPKETPSAIANAFQVVRKHGLWRQIPVMIGVMAASLLEGLSVASLFPILTIVSGDTAKDPNKVERIILGALEVLRIDKSLGALVLVMIALSVLKAIISLNVSRYVGYLVAEIATELRSRMIDAMLAARWSYYTINPVGRFASAITNEANWGAAIYRTSLNLLTSAIQVLVLAGIVFSVDWKVGLIGVGMALVVGTAMRWLTRRSRLFSRRMLLTTRAIVTDLNDVVVGFKPMKAMHRHEILVDELRNETRSLRKALRELVLLEQLASRLPDLLIIVMLTIVAYTGIVVLKLDLPSMLVSGILVMGLTRSFAKMQRSVRESVNAEVGYYSLMETLRETENASETYSGTREPLLRDSCRLEDVTFSYGRATVLERVSMELRAGTITTLIGESGSGKTTAADLILGLFEPNAGRVTLDGVPLPEIDIGRWRSMVGYVPQEILLFNDSILMNVTLGDPQITEEDALQALERAGAKGFINDLPEGLKTTVGDRGVLLSGGQRQRIALARALVTKPALLILDEATSALDPETEASICATVARERGHLTVLAITHQPAWVALADRVYHIARGKVRELNDEQRQSEVERARPRNGEPSRAARGDQAESGRATGAPVTFPSRIS